MGCVKDDRAAQVAEVAAPPPAAEVVQITEIVGGGDTTQATAVGIKVVPSIVTVEVGSDAGPNGFLAVGSGSGVVLNADGAIATNHHVVADADDLRAALRAAEEE